MKFWKMESLDKNILQNVVKENWKCGIQRGNDLAIQIKELNVNVKLKCQNVQAYHRSRDG